MRNAAAAPDVSVVIPSYNHAAFIGRAVRSALDQEGVQAEIIVIDDASTDGTRQVLEPFLGGIRLLSARSRGPAHARNVGMAASTGRYIAFLDSDDMYLPGKLALQAAFLDGHPEVGFVSTDMSAMKDDVVFEERHLRSYHGIFRRKGWSYGDLYPVSGEFRLGETAPPVPYFTGSIFRQMLQGQVLITNTVLFRRELLDTVGGQNESYRTGEDYEFLARLCRRCSAGFLDVPTYMYRYHDRQVTMSVRGDSREKVLTDIGTEKVFLRTVLDWGYGDREYYAGNRDWIDRRIAELFACIGKKWLEIGETRKAAEAFTLGLGFDPTNSANLRGIRSARLPSVVRRSVDGVTRRLRSLR